MNRGTSETQTPAAARRRASPSRPAGRDLDRHVIRFLLMCSIGCLALYYMSNSLDHIKPHYIVTVNMWQTYDNIWQSVRMFKQL